MLLTCDDCSAHRCVYSKIMIGRKEGPTETDMQYLQQLVEKGYVCGSRVPGKEFYDQRKKYAGDYIESQYYNHLDEKKKRIKEEKD